MVKKKIKQTAEPDLTPIVEIGNENINAHYYYDGSGEIGLEYDGEQFFFKDDGKLKHHIEYIEEFIGDLQKGHKEKIAICKKAISLLKKAKL